MGNIGNGPLSVLPCTHASILVDAVLQQLRAQQPAVPMLTGKVCELVYALGHWQRRIRVRQRALVDAVAHHSAGTLSSDAHAGALCQCCVAHSLVSCLQCSSIYL